MRLTRVIEHLADLCGQCGDDGAVEEGIQTGQQEPADHHADDDLHRAVHIPLGSGVGQGSPDRGGGSVESVGNSGFEVGEKCFHKCKSFRCMKLYSVDAVSDQVHIRPGGFCPGMTVAAHGIVGGAGGVPADHKLLPAEGAGFSRKLRRCAEVAVRNGLCGECDLFGPGHAAVGRGDDIVIAAVLNEGGFNGVGIRTVAHGSVNRRGLSVVRHGGGAPMLAVIGVAERIDSGRFIIGAFIAELLRVVHHLLHLAVHAGQDDGGEQQVQAAEEQGPDDNGNDDFYSGIHMAFRPVAAKNLFHLYCFSFRFLHQAE